jgi:hypothetical protein
MGLATRAQARESVSKNLRKPSASFSAALVLSGQASTHSSFPPKRRLEYIMGNGWELLCAILGKDVPSIPFPRLNERKMHLEGVLVRRNKTILTPNKKVVPWILAMIGFGVAA